jgi:hypothetical protein
MRKWLLGSRDYTYPWMRWFDTPCTRAGAMLAGGSLALTGHSNTATLIGVVLLAVSSVVDLGNLVEPRRPL